MDLDIYSDKRTYAEEIGLLIALLKETSPEAVPPDISKASEKDKIFLLVTGCSVIIAETLWIASGANKTRAAEGVGTVFKGINRIIDDKVDGKL